MRSSPSRTGAVCWLPARELVSLKVHGVFATHGPGRKRPHRVRSGSCGGLDLILQDTWVNAPIGPETAPQPAGRVSDDGTQLLLVDGAVVDVEIPMEPAYYAAATSYGTSMVSVGQLCSDRLGIGLTNRCVYWDDRGRRCRFCSIGLNVKQGGKELRDKAVADILEVVEAALTDPIDPAKHILLGGGTPSERRNGAGVQEIAEVASLIRTRFPHVAIYAMVVPPGDIGLLRELKAAGVDELGMNIELFSDEAAARFTPGKFADIGPSEYVDALTAAVEIFGPVATRSITVVGLEPPEVTVAGCAALASRGIMPILSPFRPMKGTEMEAHPRPDVDMLVRLAEDAAAACDRWGIPLGPTCIPCQANTLPNPGGHDLYRYY